MTEIRTANGIVRGRREDTLSVFRGIPYAQAPVGERRFTTPVPAESWDGVRDALEFGPPAPQADSPHHIGNCLTLNVWTPDPGRSGLPVMVWVHGGAYRRDSSANPHYSCARLAANGVVAVSMNYRTGVEGFMHIAGAPDNRGILDQICALRWVQDNIAAFGGDPDNVTVFGQSAGAGCTAAMLAMPAAAGLFRRAMVQSIPGTYFSAELAAAISATIAAEVGAKSTAAELTGISAADLITATVSVSRRMPGLADCWGPMTITPTPFSPVVDGDVLPDAPWRAVESGGARDIDLVVGHTRDEFRLLAARFGAGPNAERTIGLVAPDPDTYRIAFPTATTAELYEVVGADWLMRMPALHLAGAQHVGGGRAWMYELTWSYRSDEGASHSLDVLLLLGTLDIDEVRGFRHAAGDEAVRLGETMRSDWVNFANTGNPGWRPYDPETHTTRVYDAETTTGPYPEENSRRIWENHRFGVLDLR